MLGHRFTNLWNSSFSVNNTLDHLYHSSAQKSPCTQRSLHVSTASIRACSLLISLQLPLVDTQGFMNYASYALTGSNPPTPSTCTKAISIQCNYCTFVAHSYIKYVQILCPPMSSQSSTGSARLEPFGFYPVSNIIGIT